MDLLELYDIAEQNGITVDAFDMGECECMSVALNDQLYIAINPFALTSFADEKVKLAHELGHCETHSFYNRYSKLDLRAKHEYRADKWAVKKLIPKDELEEAFKAGYTQAWQLAEYFDVTEDFVRRAAKIYNIT